MNRLILAALAAPLALAACATPNTATPTVTQTVTVTEEAPAPEPDEPERNIVGEDATYLAFLASKGIVSDPETSIEVGKQVCQALEEGIPGTMLVTVAEGSGFTREQGAAIVAAAVLTYCPWNEDAALS
jgi:hypothetical protein